MAPSSRGSVSVATSLNTPSINYHTETIAARTPVIVLRSNYTLHRRAPTVYTFCCVNFPSSHTRTSMKAIRVLTTRGPRSTFGSTARARRSIPWLSPPDKASPIERAHKRVAAWRTRLGGRAWAVESRRGDSSRWPTRLPRRLRCRRCVAAAPQWPAFGRRAVFFKGLLTLLTFLQKHGKADQSKRSYSDAPSFVSLTILKVTFSTSCVLTSVSRLS